jgi:hypothetical protein
MPEPDRLRLERAERNLAFLRAHSSYLTPGNGMTVWSMFGVVLRTVVISLLIWIPLLVAIFAVVGLLNTYVANDLAHDWGFWPPFGSLVDYRWRDPVCAPSFQCNLRYPALYDVALCCFYGICVLFISSAILFAFVSRSPQDNVGGARANIRLLIAIALICGAEVYLYNKYSTHDGSVLMIMAAGAIFVAVAVVTIVFEWTTPPSLNSSYWLRRSLELLIGRLFIPTLVLLPSLPFQ